jgi:hypothetical protein
MRHHSQADAVHRNAVTDRNVTQIEAAGVHGKPQPACSRRDLGYFSDRGDYS